MKRSAIVLTAGLTCLALLAGAAPVRAALIAPWPIPVRVAQADAVVVGKLGKVEEKNVSATAFPGAKDKVEYQVLKLQVEDGILGAKKGDEIRLGFVPPPPTPPGVIVTGSRPVVYSTGQEGLFFLSRHHDESFYVAPMYFSLIDKKNPTYAKDLELTKRCVKLLEDPMAGLKSKEAEDRLITAGMLINRYRSRPGGPNPNPKTEPIAADESKLILHTLADADWAMKNTPGDPFGFQMMPQNLFGLLGLTDKDGWTQPKDFKDVPEAARKWLKEHADTYRIQRFVAEKAEKPQKKE
jgi:hypothetical protein